MSEEMNPATPAEQVTAESGATQVEQQVQPEATAEQTEQETEQTEQQQKKEPWFQKRIGELTREKHEARRAAEEATRQAEQYRQYLAQLQQGQQEPQQAQAPQSNQPDVMTLAEQIATQKLEQQHLASATDRVWQAGTQEFPDFEQAVNNLALVGMDKNFVQLVVESEQAQKVLHYLGQEAHLDEAARILRLNPVQQARELTRLEFKLSQPPAPKPVSKAPAPINPVGTGKATDTGIHDDLPIEEWMRRERERSRRK